MNFTVSTAPHIHSEQTTQRLMLKVIVALAPCVAAAIYFFGWRALVIDVIAVVSCVFFEFLAQKIAKRPITTNDLSAVVTGIILAMNMPATATWWMVVIGSAVAILLVKQLFGGIGCNFLNPALAARAVLLTSWPSRMTNFTLPTGFAGDAVSLATPLAGYEAKTIQLLLGNVPGSIGEVCKIAILIGGAYLLIAKVIKWYVPVSFIGTFMIFSWIFGQNPITAVLSGGILFGAVFMATDYVTNPMTAVGKLIFGFGCGLIVAILRNFTPMAEGVTYAILIMNVVTPLIDKYIKPKVYGEVKAHA